MYVYIITSPILLMHCLTFFSTGLMTLGRNREPPKRQVNVTSDYPPSCWSVIFFRSNIEINFLLFFFCLGRCCRWLVKVKKTNTNLI